MTVGKEFADGVALVIGGSGGNGAVICERLAQGGSDVVLTFHGNAARAEEVVKSIQKLRGCTRRLRV